MMLKRKEEDPNTNKIVIWVCNNCGSKDVEQKVWRNINTEEVTGSAEEEDYCNNCQEEVKTVTEEDFIINDEDI